MSIIATNLFELNENDMTYLICKPHESLELIHYNKKLLDTENMNKYKYVRSIIIDRSNDNKVVMMSPFKSLPLEEFKEKYPDNIIVEEFIEGTMVNVFFASNKWQISTKTNIELYINMRQHDYIWWKRIDWNIKNNILILKFWMLENY